LSPIKNSVVLYKLDKNVVEIEIHNFSKFKEDHVIIAPNDVIDLSTQFRRIKMVISLLDIILTDPEQFEETMKAWGFKRINRLVKSPSKLDHHKS
jgi:hypothetical protein